jgi:hypothetical protein
MYVSLSNVGNSSNAYTDNQKFQCTSLAYSNKFFPYFDNQQVYTETQNIDRNNQLKTNLNNTLVDRNDNQIQYDINQNLWQTQNKNSLYIPFTENGTSNFKQEMYTSQKNYMTEPNTLTNTPSTYKAENEIKEKHLLPVLDSQFNLREICKQCILLEDHLSQKQKRCYDCCIKHFLALEGLSEEAITLDNEKQMGYIENLPQEIRDIQKYWHQNPDSNSLDAAQKLRQIRKRFQTNVFSTVFDKKCSNGVCSL